MNGAGRKGRFRTHCFRGHALTPENTQLQRQQGFISRGCKQCRNESRRARREAMTPAERAEQQAIENYKRRCRLAARKEAA